MSGLTAEQDNEITDYGTTSYGKEQGRGQKGKGQRRNKTSRYRDNGTTAQDKAEGKAEGKAESKAVPEYALR